MECLMWPLMRATVLFPESSLVCDLRTDNPGMVTVYRSKDFLLLVLPCFLTTTGKGRDQDPGKG